MSLNLSLTKFVFIKPVMQPHLTNS